MKVLIVGIGYVGKAMACCLSAQADVSAYDINKAKYQGLPSNVKTQSALDCQGMDFVFLCLPTDFDAKTGKFDVTAIEKTIEALSSYKGIVVLKSTVPVGYTSSLKSRYPELRLLFSPEFLRESKAVEDAKNPSRIVIGGEKEDADALAALLLSSTDRKDVPVLLTGYEEAESIKLFSNAYLALRVSYFNELDTYASSKGLNAKDIIDGVCLDPRIGNYYNNPSFGYGGYCLPKDTKQLAKAYEDVPETLISAVIASNATRKQFVASEILEKYPRGAKIGIYRLVMKSGADNFRQSAILDIMKSLQNANRFLFIYEPNIAEDTYEGIPVIKDFDTFVSSCDLILANRLSKELEGVRAKVYTRDIYSKDE